MGVRLRLHPLVFRAAVFAPHAGPAEEYALLRREAVDGRGGLRGVGGEERHQRQTQATVVGGVFAERQPATQLHIVDGRELRVFVGNAARTLFVRRRVLGGPPVTQVAAGVELTPLIV